MKLAFRSVLLTSTLFTCAPAIAQTAAAVDSNATTSAPAAAPANPPATEGNEIVVTGTAFGRSKLNAPFAISSISDAQIAKQAPISAVDVLKAIPGFSSEASGGQGGGGNLFVRGLPASGGWTYVQATEDGLPTFDEPQENFLNADEMFSMDLMTQRVEVVRGGTSPIYTNNANGGTVNLLTRLGTDTPSGQVKVTGGNHGYVRGDGYSAGPINDKILYSIGGFYRRDNGYREPGYTADKGGQIRGSLSFLLGDVRIDLTGKYLNDRTAFYTALPLDDPRNPSTSLSGLLDPLSGTLLSDNFRRTTQLSFFGNQNTSQNEDLADGVHSRVISTGAYITWNVDPTFTVTDKFRFNDVHIGYNAVFSGASPFDANSYLATDLTRAIAGFGPTVSRVGYVNTNTGTVFSPSTTGGLVLESGLWTTRVRVQTYVNDFRVNKTFDDGPFSGALGKHTVSFGLYADYFHFYEDRLQNTILTSLQNNPQLLDVVAYNAAGGVVGRVTNNGFVRYGNGRTRGIDTGIYLSPYLADSIKFGNLSVDAGLRYTYAEGHGGVYANGTRNLGDPTTLADDNVGGLTGAFQSRRDTRHATSWTVGAEYKFSPNIQTFARYTSSERLPTLKNVYQTQNVATTGIKQAEGGVRASFPGFSGSVVGFWSKFNALSATLTLIDPTGAVVNVPVLGQTETKGVETEFNIHPIKMFGVSGSATYSDPRVHGLTNLNTNATVQGVDDTYIIRVPKFLFSVTPTAYFNIGDRDIELSATVYHTSKRYVDYTNKTALPGYTTLDLNLLADITPRIQFQAHVSNLTNKVGLTEGNPRIDELSGQSTSTAIYARPIFGRIYTASLSYKW